MAQPEQFRPEISRAVLDDLDRRLVCSKPRPGLPGDGWTFGVEGAYLAELVDYWRDGYDWSVQLERINAFEHYRVVIDGIPIHFLHHRSRQPNALPLVLTHGWPWTFWDYRDTILPLADPESYGAEAVDAFDVIIPSLPGYGFSAPLQTAGVSFSRVADLWALLMRDVLGYERFGAAGGDWGGVVSAQLGHKYRDAVAGVHLFSPLRLDSFNVERPWAQLLGTLMDQAPAAQRAELLAWERRFISHLTVHTTDHQTLGHALEDSPVGTLAWLLERRRSWSDCDGQVEQAFTRDDLITHTMLYWATGTVTSAMRLYAESSRNPWVPSHGDDPTVPVPTGISLFRRDLPPGMSTGWLASYYNLLATYEHESGGHFPPSECPDVVVQDVRATFRTLR